MEIREYLLITFKMHEFFIFLNLIKNEHQFKICNLF